MTDNALLRDQGIRRNRRPIQLITRTIHAGAPARNIRAAFARSQQDLQRLALFFGCVIAN